MTTARSERGFTLLEVIIAVTLVSLLLGGVFGCVRLSLDTLNRVDARLIRERRVASVEQILRAELEGILPVIAQCTSVGDEPSERIAFFEGEPATMRFVSTYSLNERARGLPRILELQVIPGMCMRGRAARARSAFRRCPARRKKVRGSRRWRPVLVRSFLPTAWRIAGSSIMLRRRRGN